MVHRSPTPDIDKHTYSPKSI